MRCYNNNNNNNNNNKSKIAKDKIFLSSNNFCLANLCFYSNK